MISQFKQQGPQSGVCFAELQVIPKTTLISVIISFDKETLFSRNRRIYAHTLKMNDTKWKQTDEKMEGSGPNSGGGDTTITRSINQSSKEQFLRETSSVSVLARVIESSGRYLCQPDDSFIPFCSGEGTQIIPPSRHMRVLGNRGCVEFPRFKALYLGPRNIFAEMLTWCFGNSMNNSIQTAWPRFEASSTFRNFYLRFKLKKPVHRNR